MSKIYQKDKWEESFFKVTHSSLFIVWQIDWFSMRNINFPRQIKYNNEYVCSETVHQIRLTYVTLCIRPRFVDHFKQFNQHFSFISSSWTWFGDVFSARIYKVSVQYTVWEKRKICIHKIHNSHLSLSYTHKKSISCLMPFV